MVPFGEEAVVAESLVEQVQQALLVPAQALSKSLGVGARIAQNAENGHARAQVCAVVVAAWRVAGATTKPLQVDRFVGIAVVARAASL